MVKKKVIPVSEVWTTIPVTKGMAERIASLGRKRDRYEDILARLLPTKAVDR